jgi:CBS domain-containing protein
LQNGPDKLCGFPVYSRGKKVAEETPWQIAMPNRREIMSLRKFCERPLITITPPQTIAIACQLLQEKNIGCLVVEEQGKLCGILTDRDIALKVAGEKRDPRQTSVQEVMTPHPAHITADKTLHELTALMHTQHVRRVPIVDKDNTILGLVTLDDLLILLSEEMADLGEGILGALQEAEAELTEVRPPFGWLLSYL